MVEWKIPELTSHGGVGTKITILYRAAICEKDIKTSRKKKGFFTAKDTKKEPQGEGLGGAECDTIKTYTPSNGKISLIAEVLPKE